MFAASWGNEHIVKLLLANNASINLQGAKPEYKQSIFALFLKSGGKGWGEGGAEQLNKTGKHVGKFQNQHNL